MSITINRQLDPIYETIFLLYYGYDLNKYKKMLSSQITEDGFNEQEIIIKYFKSIEDYIVIFQKHWKPCDSDKFYLHDVSFEFYLSFITPFFLDKHLIDNVGHMDNDYIFKLLIQNSEEIFETDLTEYKKISHSEFVKTDSIMSFINQFELSENEKWKMLLILQNPKEKYAYFADLIKSNIPAFEKSVKSVKSSLTKLLSQYDKTYSEENDVLQHLDELRIKGCDITEVHPSMVNALSIVIMTNNAYYGILADRAMKELSQKSNGKEALLGSLKVLSDNSKFEILTTLKVSPKYASELATQLGLTPATVSHHMNALMNTNLVYLEKSNGKYYYHLNEVAMKELLDQLRSYLI